MTKSMYTTIHSQVHICTCIDIHMLYIEAISVHSLYTRVYITLGGNVAKQEVAS